MDISTLTFPLTVDFAGKEYWVGKSGPYKYGEAVTAFFIGEGHPLVDDGEQSLREELEVYLITFGNYLQPYPGVTEIPDKLFDQLEQSSAECSVNYAFHAVPGKAYFVERCTFPTLRDFLYVELGKAIIKGNAPRKCRLCGGWFLHERGGKSIYCERIAPGETGQTCREVGARAVFEKKIRDEDAWKLYKRAYKKYYARFMKGSMSREDFSAWAEGAAVERDIVLKKVEAATDAETKSWYIEHLKETLNKR